jgi:hypothetical protein
VSRPVEPISLSKFVRIAIHFYSCVSASARINALAAKASDQTAF